MICPSGELKTSSTCWDGKKTGTEDRWVTFFMVPNPPLSTNPVIFPFKILMVLTRLREYWEMEDLDFSNFTNVDINSLGTFLRGLAQEELKKLPEKILLTAIRRLGEATGLPEDKLKARAYLAVELFKVKSDVSL